MAKEPQQAAHILVVDDVYANAKLLGDILDYEGHKVTIAGSGAQALEVLMTDVFDLVLLDVLMPGIDGYKVYTAAAPSSTPTGPASVMQ